jgi:[phosphatase 2A protein]-leucine-carboxy methyltransferase
LYHEIDFPSVSAQKFAAMRSSAILSPVGSSFSVLHGYAQPQIGPDKVRWGFFRDGAIQREGYLFHPIDLRNSPFRIEGLLTDIPTLLISECCLCYLSVGGAQSVIQTFTDAISDLGIILYEPTNPIDAFGRTMFANLAARGLYMPTVHEYPTLASQYARLSQAGFYIQTGADVNWLWQNWVSEEEKERVSRLEMLDELEEWELLAAHYTVVWAWQGGNLNPGAFMRWRDMCPGQRPYLKVIPREEEVMQSIEA